MPAENVSSSMSSRSSFSALWSTFPSSWNRKLSLDKLVIIRPSYPSIQDDCLKRQTLFITASNLPQGFELDTTDNSIWFNNTKLNQSYYTESQWTELTQGFDFNNVQYSNEYEIQVTELRKDADYTIYYTNWTSFFLKGIIPTFLLIYFNYKVSFWEMACKL